MTTNWFAQDSTLTSSGAYTAELSRWPQVVTITVSAVATLGAAVRWPQASLAFYLIVLSVGTAMIFVDRVRYALRARDREVQWIRVAHAWDLGALIGIMIGCISNGLVIAFWLARR